MMDYDDGGGACLAIVHGNNKAIPFPDKWEIGQRVVWVTGDEFGYTFPGLTGAVAALRDDCLFKKGHEYQVFWCRPDGSKSTSGGGPLYWTTPYDVRPITAEYKGAQND